MGKLSVSVFHLQNHLHPPFTLLFLSQWKRQPSFHGSVVCPPVWYWSASPLLSRVFTRVFGLSSSGCMWWRTLHVIRRPSLSLMSLCSHHFFSSYQTSFLRVVYPFCLYLLPHPHLNPLPHDSYCQPSADGFLVKETIDLQLANLFGLYLAWSLRYNWQCWVHFFMCSSLSFHGPNNLSRFSMCFSAYSKISSGASLPLESCGDVCWSFIVTVLFYFCVNIPWCSTSIYNTQISISGSFCQHVWSTDNWAFLLAVSQVCLHSQQMVPTVHQVYYFIGLP